MYGESWCFLPGLSGFQGSVSQPLSPSVAGTEGPAVFKEEAGGGQENGLEAERLGQHNTYAEDRGLSLVCKAQSNPIQSVETSGFTSVPRYQANIPCAIQNRGQVLAAAKKTSSPSRSKFLVELAHAFSPPFLPFHCPKEN